MRLTPMDKRHYSVRSGALFWGYCVTLSVNTSLLGTVSTHEMGWFAVM